MARRLSLCVLLVAVFAAPLAAQIPPPAVATDRLGFTQPSSAAEIGLLTWAIFIDTAQQSLAGVSCTATAAAGAFDCVAPFPAMTPGTHTLELIAIRTEGTLVVESVRSAPFQVRFVVAPAAPSALRIVR